MVTDRHIKVLSRREGNKYNYINNIVSLFPFHTCYIEPFLGTGAIFLNKSFAQFNKLNDSSKFIYDYFMILKNEQSINDFIKRFEETLIYFDLIKHDDSVEATIIKIMYSYMSTGDTQVWCDNSLKKQLFINNLMAIKNILVDKLKYAQIVNKDVFEFLKYCCRSKGKKNKNTFIYCDPPYSISQGNLKDNKGWSIEKLELLIDTLISFDCNFAISEYNDNKILDIAKKKGLIVNIVGNPNSNKVNTLKKEILMTNYQPNDLLTLC